MRSSPSPALQPRPRRDRFAGRIPSPGLLGVLLAGLVWVVTGCGGLGTASLTSPTQGDALHEIVRSGRLRVGLSGVQPPLNMKSRTGELIGLDVDLARALADAMELELELIERPFGELIGDLEAGDLDMVISSLTITPARNARVAFAGPYMISGAALLTRAEAVDDFDRIEALDSPERRWAALAGSTHETLIAEAFPLAKIVLTEDLTTMVEAIRDGRVDGLFTDLPQARYLQARHPEAGLRVREPAFTIEPLGIALPADSPLLVNLVQNYLNTLDYTGLLIQMKVRWLSGSDWLSELP